MTQLTDYSERVMMKDLVEIARYIFMNKLDHGIYMSMVNTSPDSYKAILQAAYQALYSVQFSSVLDASDIRRIAGIIEPNTFLSGLIFDGTSEFFAHYNTTIGLDVPEAKDKNDALFRVLAEALGVTRTYDNQELVALSEEYMNRGADQNTWYAILQNNSWMAFMYIIRLTYINPAEVFNLRAPAAPPQGTRRPS